MKNVYPMKECRHCVRALIAIVFVIMLAKALGDSRRSLRLGSKGRPVPEAHKQRIAKGLAHSFGVGPFEPSLTMRETADFFLTPALLVQEAICDDIVITYPAE